MKRKRIHWIMVVGFCCAALARQQILCAMDDPARDVSFSLDIRPILSDTCFKCHGPDDHQRQADLRLDIKTDALQDLISAGDADESELYRRIMSHDESELMPPPESGRKLSDRQKELIKRWIQSGATWQTHWSFTAPAAPEVPQFDSSWVANPIDGFVLRRLKDAGLSPNQVADRETLIRRVSLDLTGLPPTRAMVEQFSRSRGADWYQQLVDRLLASPAYGEHMARFWLDAARYGDTHGLHLDNYREIWLYRDWVINAFNENKSFCDFTIEQLAGDLLESPTDQQLIATGFNRAHVSTAEGGSIKEEVFVRNVVDRVSTTGTVFMGLTIGCAQCHDHKYDPISQREFYQLFAFFNSLDADPMDGNRKDHEPVLRYSTEIQNNELASMRSERDRLNDEVMQKLAEFQYMDPQGGADSQQQEIASEEQPDAVGEEVWFDDQPPEGAKLSGSWNYVSTGTFDSKSGDRSVRDSNDAFSQIYFTEAKKMLRFLGDDTLFAHVYLDPDNPPDQIMLQWYDGKWEHRAYWGDNNINFGADGTTSRRRLGDLPESGQWVRLEVKASDVGFSDTSIINGIAFSQWGGQVHWDRAGVVTSIAQSFDDNSLNSWIEFQLPATGNGLPEPVANVFKKKRNEWNEDDHLVLKNHFLREIHPASKALVELTLKKRNELDEKIKQFQQQLPTTLIWKETSEPKDAFILLRGEYDKHGDHVERDTPVALPAFPDDQPRNRLGLANWLVSDSNPLTARVTVNRIWQQFFGRGLVETTEDFGAQGQVPSHPELLDWLAVDFVLHDWDVKRLVKSIVMSSTYRQSSETSPGKLRIDPGNRLLSRGPRLRLDAEMLRDQALAVSGLLVSTVGGPSVKPPQPDGLWFVVGYSGSNTVRFRKDVGHEKVHRRSMYTFWKRTAPPPQMSTFDAPSRESCQVRRERTNTPLQALLLMNDPQYIEAARYLAQMTIDQQELDTQRRIEFMFSRALGRHPTASESKLLAENVRQNQDEFAADQASASELIKIGEQPPDPKYDTVELASWTMLANLIMNMDEFISKN